MNWYCIHTRPQKERDVAQALEGHLQLETYFPRVRQMRRIRRVRRPVTQPLFPRYLFCRFDPLFQFRAVRFTKEVLGVVSFGDIPAVVSDSLVEGMKSWAGDLLDLTSAPPLLQPGDNVVIGEGPFQGLPAIILQDCNQGERVSVLLSLLESETRVTISRSQLIKAS